MKTYVTQILELHYKDFNVFTIKMLQRAVLNRFEMNEKIESPSKEIDDIKKNQTETLELKNIMTNIFQNFGKDINLQLQ